MAITSSAKKEIRASARKRVFNVRRSRAYKAVLKDIDALLVAGKVTEAQALVPQAYKALDKAAKMNTIKAGAADRKKSRLSKKLKKADVAK
jgi:small subunit ribosomal protein S20